MNFLGYISDLIHLGYNISFSMQSSNAVISISKEINEKTYTKQSWLPLSDHFYENRVKLCIDFMIEEIQKENTK
jgi:hypothetical protein